MILTGDNIDKLEHLRLLEGPGLPYDCYPLPRPVVPPSVRHDLGRSVPGIDRETHEQMIADVEDLLWAARDSALTFEAHRDEDKADRVHLKWLAGDWQRSGLRGFTTPVGIFARVPMSRFNSELRQAGIDPALVRRAAERALEQTAGGTGPKSEADRLAVLGLHAIFRIALAKTLVEPGPHQIIQAMKRRVTFICSALKSADLHFDRNTVQKVLRAISCVTPSGLSNAWDAFRDASLWSIH